MDKKAKRKLLNEKLQRARRQLAGAKQQMDDPQDLASLEKEVRQLEQELEKLKD